MLINTGDVIINFNSEKAWNFFQSGEHKCLQQAQPRHITLKLLCMHQTLSWLCRRPILHNSKAASCLPMMQISHRSWESSSLVSAVVCRSLLSDDIDREVLSLPLVLPLALFNLLNLPVIFLCSKSSVFSAYLCDKNVDVEDTLFS